MTSSLLPEDTRARLAELEGLVSEEVGVRLAGLAATVPAGQAIVELGSYKGKSSCYLGEGARRGLGAHVWCIDAWYLGGNINKSSLGFTERTTHEAFGTQVARMGLRDSITDVLGFAVEAAQRWVGPSVGLLFVDSHHVYEAVSADYLAWEQYLAPGAVVVFDDAHHTKQCNAGVEAFVSELRRETCWECWEFEPPPLAIGRRCS